MRKSKEMKSQRGMTLMEAIVAVAIFTVVFLTALALYQSANRAYMQTDAAAVQQQNVRFAMDRMLQSVHDAGAGYNTLGSAKVADEQIEGAWESALFVRGDFDNSRETNLESSTLFPIVTTGNDEIVGYVLRKPGANNINLTIKADFSAPRDAVYTSQTSITNEESKTVAVAATTVAGQTDPPYQLTKVTFDSSGNPQYEVVADNIYRLKFEYFGATGATTSATAIITATTGAGSADTERDERGAIRRIRVKLMGMADKPDFGYKDPWQYGADFSDLQSTLKSSYHKFALEETVLAPNLGIIGRKHNSMPALQLTAPTYITVCTGHSLNFDIRWPASTATGVTDYSLLITAPAAGTLSPVTVTKNITGGALEYQYQVPGLNETDGQRAYTFQVAATSGGIIGTYGSAATLSTSHDTTNSVPSAPTAVAGSGTAGADTMTVTWTPTTTSTGTLTASSLCTSAGSVSGGSAPPSPWNQAVPDLKEYHVYRVRQSASPGNANFSAAATNRVDTANIPSTSPLTNVTPAASASSFIDNLAAPCEDYYYKVEAADNGGLTNNSTGVSAAIPDPGENPAAPGGASAANAVSGFYVSAPGNNWNFTLSWPAVTQTVSGKPAATVHYRLTRERNVANAGWTTDTTLDAYADNAGGNPVSPTYTDTGVPQKVGGNDAIYRYSVAAVYTTCSRVGAAAGPWTMSTCNASNSITINTPNASTEISTPFESGFTPIVTVQNGGTIQQVVATITGPDGANNVVYSDVQSVPSGYSGSDPRYTFTQWTGAPSLPIGAYTFRVYAVVNGCNTATYTQGFPIGDATCSLQAVNITLTPTSGNPAYYQLGFNVQNTCDPNLGGIDFEVTGLRLAWSGYGGQRLINEVRLADPATGALITTTPLNAGTGVPFTFLDTAHQTVAAGTTTTNKWYVIFNGDMKQSTSNATTFSSIVAYTTTPANANDNLLNGTITP